MRTVPEVVQVEARPWNVELVEPFGIATGAQHVAENVLVTLTLDDGTTGLGEAAPFPAVNGETQEDALEAVATARSALAGEDAGAWRKLAAAVREAIPGVPSARAGIESALLDALCRHHGLSLWRWFGGTETRLVTDVTIPTGSPDQARAAAARRRGEGFSTLKVKVGGATLDHDAARLKAILDAAPNASLVLDANAALAAEEAIELVRGLGPEAERVVLFEQPTAQTDLDGMRRVREALRVPVAADESARAASDVAALARIEAADVVNLKITKSGLVEALDMAAAARASGLGLMIGGMVETKLAMTVSACLAAGLGGFDHVDLDTPLFMKQTPAPPTTGGFRQSGARLDIDVDARGHGVAVLEASATV